MGPCTHDRSKARILGTITSRVANNNLSDIITLSIDDNYKTPHIKMVAKAAGHGLPDEPEKPVSGRIVKLDDEVAFPLATRCTDFVVPCLVFGLDGRGGYHVAGKDWRERDHMLIFRGADRWHFLFVLTSAPLHTGVMKWTRVGAVIPYVVEDKECSYKPLSVAPQRGMPPAIMKAIYDTPFCASAISHGLMRLKYLRSLMPDIRTEGQRLADVSLHVPKAPILFRSLEGRARVRGNGRSSKVGVCRLSDVLPGLAAGMPRSRLRFDQKEEMEQIVPTVAHRPRALLLDM